ncbi:PREDICTED: protein ECERIFERUM 26-like [Camelina sativa]|uniref:Protein ECERIFERUM 26-like n=1 Tax=Camelina sativa TaxID=90675 RepID=A0ABM0Y1L7_CAMSA|nr:PREDICTED: protein ECERIFERUM 26-like [Camelina sativa]
MGIAQENRVEVKSMLTAVSSKPSRSARVHPFTALDNAMSPHTLHVIVYYPRSPFGSFDLDSVRISLSELLSMYPPVVGRVAKTPDGILEVKCNDAGLRTLKAKVCVGIDEWLRSADGHDESDLTAWGDMPEDPSTWAPFRLQINEFQGGGVAIGLSCPHRQADATTLTVLLKSWTEAQRRRCIVHPPSFSPLPSILTDDTDAVKPNSATISKPISTKTATATFRFSSSSFKKYIEEDGIFPKASPFDVFAALFWTRVALVKRKSHDRVCMCVDFRRLLPNPLPYGFFGNALNFSSLEMTNVADQGIVHVARLINDHVTNLTVEKIRSDLNRVGEQELMYGGDLTIVNMEHMIVEGDPMMYEAVFEDGVRPVHVSYRIGNVGGEGVIMVMPSPEKGFGRVVSVTLPEEEVSKLLVDQEILRFEPKIILSGVK